MKKHILLIENNFFVGLTAEKYTAETAVTEKKTFPPVFRTTVDLYPVFHGNLRQPFLTFYIIIAFYGQHICVDFEELY